MLLCPRCADLYMREDPNPCLRLIVADDYAVYQKKGKFGNEVITMNDDTVIDWEFLSAEDRRTVTAQCIEQMCGPSPFQWDENRPFGMPVYRTLIRFFGVDTWQEVLLACGWTKPMHRTKAQSISNEELVNAVSDVMAEIKAAEERRGLTVIPRGTIVNKVGRVFEVWEIR
jgi:hypothetical protein